MNLVCGAYMHKGCMQRHTVLQVNTDQIATTSVRNDDVVQMEGNVEGLPISDPVDKLFSPEIIEEIEDAVYAYMNRDFNETKRHVNLSYFGSIENVRHCNLVVSLNQPPVLYTVLQVIHDCIGDTLHGLCLANNMISSGEGLKIILELFPSLQILNLSNNKLTDLSMLECLSGFTLKYLYLRGNPVDFTCERTPYTLAVQNIFPQLQYLDFVELEPLKNSYVPPPANCHMDSSRKRKLEELELEDYIGLQRLEEHHVSPPSNSHINSSRKRKLEDLEEVCVNYVARKKFKKCPSMIISDV